MPKASGSVKKLANPLYWGRVQEVRAGGILKAFDVRFHDERVANLDMGGQENISTTRALLGDLQFEARITQGEDGGYIHIPEVLDWNSKYAQNTLGQFIELLPGFDPRLHGEGEVYKNPTQNLAGMIGARLQTFAGEHLRWIARGEHLDSVVLPSSIEAKFKETKIASRLEERYFGPQVIELSKIKADEVDNNPPLDAKVNSWEVYFGRLRI